ncbi:unnamed protein product, partial [Amoebophrya sp. A120]
DDLWLSAHLAKKRIKRELLGHRLRTEHIGFGFEPDALYLGGAGSGDNNENLFQCLHGLSAAIG